MNETVSGMLAGSVANIISYPIDTLKTLNQMNKQIIYKNLNIKRLYYGLPYPLFCGMVLNGYFFGIHSKINEYYKNSFLSGALTGVVFAPIVNPLEMYKVRRQLSKNNNFTKLNLFRGFYATLPREIIGCSLWFGTYDYLKKKNIHPIISGCATGTVSWTLSYPIDVIKTQIQSDPKLKYIDAIKTGNLWKGFKFCILRTMVYSSIIIPTYEL